MLKAVNLEKKHNLSELKDQEPPLPQKSTLDVMSEPLNLIDRILGPLNFPLSHTSGMRKDFIQENFHSYKSSKAGTGQNNTVSQSMEAKISI